MDRTFAAFTGLYNLKEENWDQKILPGGKCGRREITTFMRMQSYCRNADKRNAENTGNGSCTGRKRNNRRNFWRPGIRSDRPYAGVDVMGTTDVFM